MRIGFWRGVITGGIIGAVISMIAGARHRQEHRGILGYGSRRVRSRAHRVIRGVTKTVNDLLK
ncbi:MAG: hypothetical protein HPY89_04135 [Pelotomaculum sp.]|uniref:YtxH domain-containing protein n=1 Tax=Pelotomaculum thermopropionicum (strain DSM 13744 / JCM 10971 / SI) TaxID=370438 RepID=A5D3F2_PELTS|nr:hypothetical protein [Pelotomaculum sp.]BAF59239.1 hypothetical protein PTH_1058 [Pelotomaculum thermopropionicum SI]